MKNTNSARLIGFVFFILLAIFSIGCSNDDNTVELRISATDFKASINENPEKNQEIGMIEAATNQGVLAFEILEETPDGALSIDVKSGALSVKDAAIFDFEKHQIIKAIVKISNGNITKDVMVTISVKNIRNDIKIIAENFTAIIKENPKVGQMIGKVKAAMEKGTLDFKILDQTPEGAFSINNKGEITVVKPSEFVHSKNPIVEGVVEITSGEVIPKNISIKITVEDSSIPITVNTNDLIITMDESTLVNGQFIGKVTGETNQGSVIFSIVSQNPEGAFEINADSGALTVANPTIFKYSSNPVIKGVIKVTNGEISKDARVTIKMNDPNSDIEVTTSDFKITMDENPTNGQLIGKVVGETNQGNVTFLIVNQSPEGAFSINEATGELTVETPELFNFEKRKQIKGLVMVTNVTVSKTATITITLNDLDESPSLLGTWELVSLEVSGVNVPRECPDEYIIEASEMTIISFTKEGDLCKESRREKNNYTRNEDQINFEIPGMGPLSGTITELTDEKLVISGTINSLIPIILTCKRK